MIDQPRDSGAIPPPRPARPRLGLGRAGARSLLIALVSAVVFFTAIGLVVTNAPNWPRIRDSFFNWDYFAGSAPGIAGKFLVNVRVFLIADCSASGSPGFAFRAFPAIRSSGGSSRSLGLTQFQASSLAAT